MSHSQKLHAGTRGHSQQILKITLSSISLYWVENSDHNEFSKWRLAIYKTFTINTMIFEKMSVLKWFFSIVVICSKIATIKIVSVRNNKSEFSKKIQKCDSHLIHFEPDYTPKISFFSVFVVDCKTKLVQHFSSSLISQQSRQFFRS